MITSFILVLAKTLNTTKALAIFGALTSLKFLLIPKKICLLLLKITTLMPQKIKLQGLSGITGVLLTKITIAITILVEL